MRQGFVLSLEAFADSGIRLFRLLCKTLDILRTVFYHIGRLLIAEQRAIM